MSKKDRSGDPGREEPAEAAAPTSEEELPEDEAGEGDGIVGDEDGDVRGEAPGDPSRGTAAEVAPSPPPDAPAGRGPAAEAEAADRLLGELEELKERHLRLAAEFENYRRRTREELLKTRELGQAELTRRLLDALDDLGRIAETPAEATTVDALHEGVALVERKLLKELAEAGLEPMEAEGAPFDPAVHEAVTTVPTDDPAEDDVVSRVFVRGYRFGDRLLRPARVEVKKVPAESGEPEGDEETGRGR